MADTPDRDEKTEAPTGKRLREAARDGDVLQSKELGTALVVMAGAAWLALGGPWLLDACEEVLKGGLTFRAADVETFEPWQVVVRLVVPVLLPLATLFGLTIVAAIGTPAMLGSLGFRWGAVGFKPAKMNPLSGLKRILGPQGLVELGKSLAKIGLLGGVAWWLLKGRMPSIMGLGRQDLTAALGEIGHVFTISVLVMGIALVAIAGIDVPIQMIRRMQRLRMTKQQVKDEHKESEGSPEMKGHIRGKQRQILSSSTRKAMKEASVVLTNPTHFAVALRYRPGFDVAPVVLAKGKDEVAAAIREFADENAVPMLSYPQLTRALYFTSRAGDIIREDLYTAVATILAFVFNLDRAMAEGIRQPQVDVPKDVRFDEHGRTSAS